MINNTLKELLKKRQDNLITDDEMKQLVKLTHRDEVMSLAVSHASSIRTRRIRTINFCIATILIAGTIFWFSTPKADTLIASKQHDTIQKNIIRAFDSEITPSTSIEDAGPQQITAAKNHTVHKSTITIKQMPKHIKSHSKSDAIVMCNNQCDADSVINEIWNFLSV